MQGYGCIPIFDEFYKASCTYCIRSFRLEVAICDFQTYLRSQIVTLKPFPNF